MEDISKQSYDGIKTLSKDNVKAKQELVSKLLTAGCGRWIAKPVEQDQFYLGDKPLLPHKGDKPVVLPNKGDKQVMTHIGDKPVLPQSRDKPLLSQDKRVLPQGDKPVVMP